MNINKNHVILTADLGYGDAGKGSIVDFLARSGNVHTVVRYNGGAQAAHNVITPEGRHHTFAQFGSATFIPGVRTHLSRFMLLHPLAMLAEERALRALGVVDAFQRTTIDRAALVITPYQQAANRLKEIARGAARHGSCGMGIGETMADWLTNGNRVIFAADLEDPAALQRKLNWMREAKLDQLQPLLERLPETPAAMAERRLLEDAGSVEIIADLFLSFAAQARLVEPKHLGTLLRQPGAVVFEGAQGVLLDEWYGFYPYNSWSTLTFKNADTLLDEAGSAGDVYRLGILRGYMTRHGAGPFVSEDAALTASLQDYHNQNNPWQRAFRVGPLDLLALRYALEVVGKLDGLAVTNLDRMEEIAEWQVCDRYEYSGMNASIQKHFEVSAGQITAIHLPTDPTDLVQQEELTHLLEEMQPGLTLVSKNREEYLDQISQEFSTPVVIQSTGPSASDKLAIASRSFPAYQTPGNSRDRVRLEKSAYPARLVSR